MVPRKRIARSQIRPREGLVRYRQCPAMWCRQAARRPKTFQNTSLSFLTTISSTAQDVGRQSPESPFENGING
jgi:hypothetical protein